jgi:hypothetical protein
MTNSVQALTSAAMTSVLSITPASLQNKTDFSKERSAYFNSSVDSKVGNSNLCILLCANDKEDYLQNGLLLKECNYMYLYKVKDDGMSEANVKFQNYCYYYA